MLRICDPHIHLWDLATGLYPGLEKPSAGFSGDNTAIARSYLLPEYLGEAGGGIEIAAAVHVEAFPTDSEAEVRHVQRMAEAAPMPLAIVGNADLRRPDIAGLLDRMCAFPALRGVRKVVNLHPDPWFTYVTEDFLDDPAFARGFAELGPRGLSFDLQLYPHQAKAAARLVAANPGTRVVLNHAGMWADRNLGGWTRWKAALRVLAGCPNVWVKISGLGMFDHRFTTQSIRPLVLETLEAFGTGRAMFASNFPVDKLYSTYPVLWQSFGEIVRDLPEAERRGLFETNARTFYRI